MESGSDAAHRLDGRVVLVTGSTRGIGHGIAAKLASLGAAVVVSARDGKLAGEVATALGNGAIGIESDLGRLEAPQELVREVVSRTGRLDGLVNNAGASLIHPSAEMSHEEWHRIIDLNLTASFFCSQAAAAAMGQKGSIVNIASVASFRGLPGRAAYGASKAAIVAITRTLAAEWAPRIRVNAVAPGYIRTDSMDRLIGEGKIDAEAIEARTPASRFGTPADVGEVVAFLLGDGSTFVTGDTVAVDGGFLATT